MGAAISFYDWLQRFTGDKEFAVLARAMKGDPDFPRHLTSSRAIRIYLKSTGAERNWRKVFNRAWFRYEKEEL